jgi:uncharacterized SAM-binding protein YcdF (DUF218 family)
MSNKSRRRKIRILYVPAELVETLNRLSRRTILRCQKALELWQHSKYDYLAVTGGIFLPRDIQTEPAGLIMARWFHERGVDPERLIIEQHSRDTYENITGSVAEIRNLLGRRCDSEGLEITIVTQWQHARRFQISFRKLHPEIEVKTVAVNYPLSAFETLKEYLFIGIHYVDPRGAGPFGQLNRWLRNRAALPG